MTDQVAEIKAKTDIVEIISERVDLKKAGNNFKGLCPFHNEKTPSFMVSPEIQIYKCFGCDRSGDVYSFLMEYEAMEFPESLQTLADKAGVKLVRRKSSGRSDKEKLFEVNSMATRYYQYILLKHPAGRDALNYLLKDRGLTNKSILDFSLGFSPDSPGAIKEFLNKKKKVHKSLLQKSGIFYERSGNLYDRFRGRVIFPLHDHRGNTTGFAGRLLPKDGKKKIAKYINNPETPIYHKSNLLYGLNMTRAYIKNSGQAVIVEGELDVISTHQAGIKNTIAIKGSALTTQQSKLLKRFANQIVFALDTDEAGIKATLRGITVAQKDEFEIRVAVLGRAKDPDELARSNPQKLINIIKNSVGAWDFIIDTIFAKYDSRSGSGKAKISREVVPVLSSIDDAIVRSHYISVVAKKLQVSEDVVINQLRSKTAPSSSAQQRVVDKKTSKKPDRKLLLENRLVAVVFKKKYKKEDLKKAKTLIDDPALNKLLKQYIKFKAAHKNFDPAKFSENLPGELMNIYARIVLKDELEDVDAEKEYLNIINELEILKLKQDLVSIGDEIKLYEKAKDTKKLKSTQRRFAKVTIKLAETGSN